MMNRRHLMISSPALLGACAPLRTTSSEGPRAGEQRPWRVGDERVWVWMPRDKPYRDSWPLLVFLHGSGERGSDLAQVKVHGPPKLIAEGAEWPMVVVSPQLEVGATWNPERLHALLERLKSELDVDPRRCLATGLSLGGHGVWNWACAYPRDLAGIAPVCGYGDPARVAAMRGVPVRAYHGDADTVVPLTRQQACIDALRAAGGTASFTIYPGVTHDSWTPAYRDPELIPWLRKQRLS